MPDKASIMSKHFLISARYMDDGSNLTSHNELNAQARRLGVAYTA